MKIKDLFNKLFAFLIPILGGLLGAIGGSGNKGARRIGIPLLLSGYAYYRTENIFTLSIMTMAGVLSLGYGIPEPDGSDEGSALGRFWYKIFKGNHLLADVFTRGTIGVLIALSMISVPIINKNWVIYGLCSLGIILVQTLISWRGIGEFILFNKKLSKIEFFTWGLITLCAILIISIR
jgi:hypothetical protein